MSIHLTIKNCKADQQTANHIITECPLYRPTNGLRARDGLHGLINVDADAATKQVPRNLAISFGYL